MPPRKSDAAKAIAFLESLRIPEGPNAGKRLKLAPFQKQFIEGAFSPGGNVGVLSIGRGNAKTALSAGIALGELMGGWNRQPRREIVIAARTRDQGAVAHGFCEAFIAQMPEDEQELFSIRRGHKLEIEYHGDGGSHVLRVVPADGKSVLGSAPNLILMDERGHWEKDKGDALEHALLSGMGKRGGRALIISTSAPDDANAFSVWLDEEQDGVYRQEHRPPPGLPADDLDSLKMANPGAEHGIGSDLTWLQGQARRAIKRGGSTLTAFRLYNRNERVSGETRDLLLTVDQWLGCETAEPPERDGACVVGIDLGGSASMSAAAFYWPKTGRLEANGWFPSDPSLGDRGATDGVGQRYCEMQGRGELSTLGSKTVPVSDWLAQIAQIVQGQNIAAIVCDRFKQAEIEEGLAAAGITAPIVWRGMGFRDGSEDVQRFQRAVFDDKVRSVPSLLLRSAFADAVTIKDPAANLKIAKARSTGRIDAACAAVLAVAEGARLMARPQQRAARMVWG